MLGGIALTFAAEADAAPPAFLRPDVEEQELDPPQAVYARLDHESTRDEWVFDAVDATWFDSRSPGRRGWLADPARVDDAGDRVSIVRVPRTAIGRELGQRWWYVLAFSEEAPTGETHTVTHHLTLYGAGIPRRLRDVRPATAAEAARLGAAGSMSGLPDADRGEIERLLAQGDEADAVGVYDVGQGSANALLAGGRPRLLFDLGGGVLAHRATFPGSFTGFCLTARPPVVLSHWDWDHWSSAGRFPAAFRLPWILPRQGAIGATHSLFLATLRRLGRPLPWPAAADELGRGIVRVQRCMGAPGNRNATGLAMTVGNEGAPPILLPGDAGYHVMTVPDPIRSVVAAHHGGRIAGSAVPASDRSRDGRVVFSHGHPNRYGHPRDDVVDEHLAEFAQALATPRLRPELGHVQLRWDGRAPEGPACGGTTCSLRPTQG